MHFLLIFLLMPLLCLTQASADAPPEKKVLVHNRVLAHVNGNAISVIDLVKRMDMVLFQKYPQYLDIPEARFQFYTTQWRQTLLDCLDRELVLADAEEKKFEVSTGDVREELEEIFGPNMMYNLDSAGLTADEAFKMLKQEITLRRMLFMQVRSRVFATVTPSQIRARYAEYVNELSNQTRCTWSAVTIKSRDIQEARDFAEQLFTLVQEQQIHPSQIDYELKNRGLAKETITVTVTDPFEQKSSELSKPLQELFQSMQKGNYCRPQLQKSRSGQGDLFRLYFIHELSETVAPPIQEVEAMLRDEVTEKLTQMKIEEYYADLRRHFHVAKDEIENALPPNFQPFELK